MEWLIGWLGLLADRHAEYFRYSWLGGVQYGASLRANGKWQMANGKMANGKW